MKDKLLNDRGICPQNRTPRHGLRRDSLSSSMSAMVVFRHHIVLRFGCVTQWAGVPTAVTLQYSKGQSPERRGGVDKIKHRGPRGAETQAPIGKHKKTPRQAQTATTAVRADEPIKSPASSKGRPTRTRNRGNEIPRQTQTAKHSSQSTQQAQQPKHRTNQIGSWAAARNQ